MLINIIYYNNILNRLDIILTQYHSLSTVYTIKDVQITGLDSPIEGLFGCHDERINVHDTG